MSSSSLLRYGSNPTALARARATLVERDRELARVIGHVRARFEAGEFEPAAAWAQIAAYIGWARPGTRLALPELEEMLVEMGRRLVGEPVSPAAMAEPRTVLHVMTQAYETGGHTRVMERWVARDWRASTVVLTDQKGAPPANMVERLRHRGARLVPSLTARDLLGKARELRSLAGDHDLVVVHAHMHDVIPSLAFAETEGRPPVVFFDHAAHQLWLGTATSDVVASMRDIEERVLVERRGFPPERTARLPIPHEPRELPSREESRAQLNLPDEQQLILAVAAPWKVRAVLEPAFAEICEAVLERNPQAVMLVVGPQRDAQWTGVLRRHGARLLLPGPLEEIRPLLAAADVYLDTWPASGGTTIVDVAAAGIPIVSYNDGSQDLGMVRVVSTLGDGVVNADTPATVATAVATVLGDPARRTSMSSVLTQTVDERHGAGWVDYLERVVAAAVEHRGAATPVAPEPTAPADWQCMMELMFAVSLPSLADLLVASRDILPPAERPLDVDGYELLARRLVEREDGGDGRRAIVAPVVTPTAIGTAFVRIRELVGRGEVNGCVVILPTAHLDEGMQLLQAELDSGGDLDVEVMTDTSVEAVARPGDVVVTAAPDGQLPASRSS